MPAVIPSKLIRNIVIFFFFITCFVYFAYANNYHLVYLEENQLFRYDLYYVADFFSKPGGLITFAGAFLTQFLHLQLTGALLITMLCFILYFLINRTLLFYRIEGIAFSLIPVVFLISLHSNHNYLLANTVGWLLVYSVFRIYVTITDSKVRYSFGMLSFVVMYFIAGVFSFITLLLIVIHEVFYVGLKKSIYYIAVLIGAGIIIPVVTQNVIMLTDDFTTWLYPFTRISFPSCSLFFILLTLYCPMIITSVCLYYRIYKKSELIFTWNSKHISAGISSFALAVFMLFKLSYDYKTELFLKIDANIRSENWENVLRLSAKYPGNNQLVMYYTNLALYNTGRLADSLFFAKQSGTNGLWINWKRNEIAPFYGSEFYYQLGYTNEAYRWTFEAMEAKGLNPVSLNRLIITSLINSDYDIARKFNRYLNQTLFYHKKAQYYYSLLNDTATIHQHKEISLKRKFKVKHDFISGTHAQEYELTQLLLNNPHNRMAFEYLMASYLLNKNLKAFASNICRMKEFNYQRIPRHYEEAIILYSGLTKQNILPEGYTISSETQKRFHEYAKQFAAYRYSLPDAARILQHSFGNTFWYYMQFAGTEQNSQTGS